MNEQRKKVLAVSWHPGGANAICPVIEELRKEKRVETVVVGHEFSEAILQNKGIGYNKLADWGIVDVSVGSMIQLLRKESPDLVLAGTSVQNEAHRDVIEQTTISAARKLGIKSLTVLDYWANYSERFTDIYTGEKFKFLSDKLAIMDKIAKQEMLTEGFNEERLIITGNPHFDDLPLKARAFTETEKNKVLKKAGLDCGFLIVYAGSAWKKVKDEKGFSDMDNIIIIQEALEGLIQEKRAAIGVVIKLHPRTPEDDTEEIEEFLQEIGNQGMKLVRDIDTQKLVLASSLVLVADSTMGIEAIYMKRPCISLQPGLKGTDPLLVSRHNLIPAGYTKGKCKELVGKAVVDSKFRSQIQERSSVFRTDGQATRRVTELVYKMLKEGTK